MLRQRNGGASFSIYFPDSEKISWRNERFFRIKGTEKYIFSIFFPVLPQTLLHTIYLKVNTN